MVSITYGHGDLRECDNKTGWAETEGGIAGTLSVLYGDVFEIKCEDVNTPETEYVYYEKNIDNISSDTYPKFLLRYKTSVSANGVGARVRLIFTSGEQWILGGSEPQFSTTWKVVSGDITSDKTIDKIQLWADDWPNSIDSGTYYVYFEFVLLHKGTFTFPFVHTLKIDPELNDVELGIPGRDGDITQDLGSKLTPIYINGEMDVRNEDVTPPQNPWKITPRGTYGAYGEIFYSILHEASSDPWQWLTSELANFKVRLIKFPLSMERDSKVQRRYELLLKEYRLSDASHETYEERFGL